MSPEVTAALVAAATSVVVVVLSHLTTDHLQRKRLRTELKTEFMAERAIVELLKMRGWRKRTFVEIQRKIGGFSDEALRQLLVRAGAVRFERREDGAELWGLLDLNREDLAKDA